MKYNYLMSDFHELAIKGSCLVWGNKIVLELSARGTILVKFFDLDENITDVLDDEIDNQELDDEEKEEVEAKW